MIIPYKPEELFETPKEFDVVSFENDVLVIDNWYKNYEDIKRLLLNTPVPRWKWSEDSKNFVDYFDCRLILPVHFPGSLAQDNLSVYVDIVTKFYGIANPCLKSFFYEFNYYKNIKLDVPKNLQHYPHMDYAINCIIYMDEISSGGTAIYETDSHIENKEATNLLYDISELNKTVIEAKPNRLVMFKGHKYHGGYIEDHNKYVKDWRINQIMFFENA
jgi:hypothetical protein